MYVFPTRIAIVTKGSERIIHDLTLDVWDRTVLGSLDSSWKDQKGYVVSGRRCHVFIRR